MTNEQNPWAYPPKENESPEGYGIQPQQQPAYVNPAPVPAYNGYPQNNNVGFQQRQAYAQNPIPKNAPHEPLAFTAIILFVLGLLTAGITSLPALGFAIAALVRISKGAPAARHDKRDMIIIIAWVGSGLVFIFLFGLIGILGSSYQE